MYRTIMLSVKDTEIKKSFTLLGLESIGFIYVYFNPPNSPEEQILHLHFINEDIPEYLSSQRDWKSQTQLSN